MKWRNRIDELQGYIMQPKDAAKMMESRRAGLNMDMETDVMAARILYDCAFSKSW